MIVPTLSKKLHALFVFCAATVIAFLFSGCGGTLGTDTQSPPPAPIESSGAPKTGVFLRPGDLLKVEFSGPANPPQTVEEHIREDGTISLYLIGSVKAVGKTPGDLQKEIQELYVPKYYKNLNVTVRASDQLYYVGGQVRNGGRQPYLGPVTVLGAIKAAGDFTDFADRKRVRLIRADHTIHIINCIKALENPDLDLPVYPGDTIDVKERWY